MYAHLIESLTKPMKHIVYFTEKDKSMSTEKYFSLNFIILKEHKLYSSRVND